MKRYALTSLFLILLLSLLPGCRLIIAESVTATLEPGAPGQPIVEESEAPSVDAPQEEFETLAPIPVQDVQVEVGVGSPIPVTVRVAGTWPGLCAQLAHVTQSLHDFRFEIGILATPGDAACAPDNVGLPFALGIPINVVELPAGSYVVTVNGVSAGFDVPVVPPTSSGSETPPVPEGEAGEAQTICPDVPRPAVALSLPGGQFLITDPLSGAECRTTLEDRPATFRAAGSSLYYAVQENEQVVIKQLSGDGAALLPFTAVDAQDALAFHNFVVSPDGATLAWAAGAPAEDDAAVTVSQIWVGETTTGDAWTPLAPYRSGDPDGFRRVMVPIRFSADNSMLYYTIQPYGLGGAWNSFTGRYDNLYAIRLKSEAPPEKIFDCAELGLLLCLGDFFVVDNHVADLAYVNDDGAVIVVNGAGEMLNAFRPGRDYLASPTYGPTGELVFYAADIDESSGPPRPSRAAIYRAAPSTAPAEVLVDDPGLLPPQAWLDDTRVVTGYSAAPDNWGTATVDVNGVMQVLHSEPNATFVTVLPRPGS